MSFDCNNKNNDKIGCSSGMLKFRVSASDQARKFAFEEISQGLRDELSKGMVWEMMRYSLEVSQTVRGGVRACDVGML